MSDSNVSKEHKQAQQVIADILKQFFHIVKIEVPVPVPNPARVIGYTGNAPYSTKPYYLDVLAESPIWIKINHTKYSNIAVEIDCHKGHNSDRATTRDNTRTKLIKKHYPIKHIFRYYCKDVIGKKPKLDEEWLLDKWRILPNNAYYADKLDKQLISGKGNNK